MSGLLLRAEGVARVYGSPPNEYIAITGIDLEVRAGDRIAMVGRSGSGKTTLLHLLAGLDDPTAGRIEWPGLGPKAALRPGPVAVAFQGPSLLPPLNVLENVELPVLLADGDEVRARIRAGKMLERFELSEVAERMPEDLSGGQLQRAALARALCGRPRLLLADEPTGHQDHLGGMRVMDRLLSGIDEIEGSALIVATHDPRVAERLGITWTIEEGRLDAGVRTR